MVAVKRISAFFTLVGLLIIVYFITLFITITPMGCNYLEWKQVMFFFDQHWKLFIGFVVIFLLFTLVSAMHTLTYADISNYENEIRKLTDEYNQSRSELANKLSEYEILNKNLNNQLEFCNNEISQLKQSITQLEEELLQKNETINSLNKEFESYKNNFAELNKKFIEVSDKANRFEAEYKQLEYNYNKLLDEYKNLKSSYCADDGFQAGEQAAKYQAAIPDSAFQILYMLQKEGRLIDFLLEDISEVSDEQLGAAVRPLHENLRKILKERLVVEPVINAQEGDEVTIPDSYETYSIKLIGNVPACGPYKGILIHKGWKLKACNLPSLVGGWKGNIIVPAEVEVS